VPEVVSDATSCRGVDLVYDPVGGSASGETVQCLANGARLLAVGFASGSWVAPDVSQLFWRNASVMGVYAGGLTRAEPVIDHDALLELEAEGRISGATTVIPFDALPESLNAVDRAEAVGKIVIQVTRHSDGTSA